MILRVLITGVNGFFGLKLASYLLSKKFQVYGIGRNKKAKIDGIHYSQIDVSLENDIDHIVKKCDIIYHFAALTAHDDIINNPDITEEVSINGTKLLLDSIEKQSDSKVLIFASSETIVFINL